MLQSEVMSTWNDEEGPDGGATPTRGMWRDHIDDPGPDGRPVLRRTRTSVDEIATLVGEGWRMRRILERCPTITELEVRACLDFALDRRAQEIARDPAGAVAQAEASSTRVSHDEIVRELTEAEAEDGLPPDENDP